MRILSLLTPSPAWCGKMSGSHLRQMLEKPIFGEGQGVASTVYVKGKCVGEADYIRQALQRAVWKGMGGGGEGACCHKGEAAFST